MVTPKEVVAAYRAILGRDPESTAIIEQFCKISSLEVLLRLIVNSNEHVEKTCWSSEASATVEVASFVSSAIDEQINPWRFRSFSRAFAQKRNIFLNQTQFWMCVININGSNVSLLEKSNLSDYESKGFPIRVFLERSHQYHKLIQDAVEFSGLCISTDLIINLGDEAKDDTEFPIFSFQKKLRDRNLLLPDFELLVYDYLEKSPIDDIHYSDKKNRAVFAGSTTGGGLISLESAKLAGFPRLRAAQFFRDKHEVDFRLPALVQCSPEAQAYLQSEGYGIGKMEWSEAFRSKFILSMDGNGATCSRPAITLQSNSILIKYDSENVLFWTNSLVPWKHYIPVRSDNEVIDVVRLEANKPNFFRHIADAGADFYKKVLSKNSILRYTSGLIQAHANLYK